MSKKRNIFDEILASAPLNSTAAKVTSRGQHYDPKVEYADHRHWDAPPPMKRGPKHNPNFVDLTGRRFGRFTVLGLGDTKRGKGSSGGSWVVRCACGDYEHRTKKAILNPLNADDKCRKCIHLETTRKRFERLGSRQVEEFKD